MQRKGCSSLAEGVSICSAYETLAGAVLSTCREQYGPRLLSLAVFGSVSRRTRSLILTWIS